MQRSALVAAQPGVLTDEMNDAMGAVVSDAVSALGESLSEYVAPAPHTHTYTHHPITTAIINSI